MSEFGKLLKEYRQRTVDPQNDGGRRLTQARLAELMESAGHVSDKVVSFWETGERKIAYTDRVTLVCLIRVLHEHGGIEKLEEANALLQAGLYAPLTQAEVSAISSAWHAEAADPSPINRETHLGFVVYNWLERLFRWSDADEHARTSWAGMFIWSFAALLNHLTPQRFLVLLLGSLLWVIASWILTPILQWPLDSAEVRLAAVQRFVLGWYVLPLLLALFTPADSPTASLPQQPAQKTLFGLRFIGGLVGFNTAALMLLFLALGWYYVSLPPLYWGWRSAALFPLLLGYVTVRRTPADNARRHNGVVTISATDSFFLAAFLLAGPVVGLFIYLGYTYLAQPGMGTSLLLVLIGLSLWERQGRRPLPEPMLITVLGLAIPLAIFALLIGFGPLRATFWPPPDLEGSWTQILVITYFLSGFVLWLTLQLRARPTITLSGALLLLVTAWICAWIASIDLFWGQITSAAILGYWLFWGRRQLRRHLHVHAAAGWLLLAIGVSLWQLVAQQVPVWLNLLLFVAAATGLIVWGYRTNKPG
ncbi:MAG: hypothetical protein KDE04_03065 [Anaerolineales bacterium]|nr:hypothetical protein [Anaerolineales bacterium]